MAERLQKVLARCGVGSRRECETLIEQGRVQVDGKVVIKLGTKVEPGEVDIKVDGERVRVEDRVCYLVNKPRGYVCTSSTVHGERRVIDLVPEKRRIYTVGRLDERSEGLVLLTNDGTLSNVICHPRYQVDKTYRLTVQGKVDPKQLERIEKGVWLPEGKSAPAQVRRVDRQGASTVVTVTLWEGRSRELRRIFGKVDLRVSDLVRTAIGPLHLEGLKPGGYRRLTEEEIAFARERLRADWKPPAKWRADGRGPRREGPPPHGRRRRPDRREARA
ncbi:MAG TPA: pseudouridine synthase [Planctomycetota bacterium]|nr:pseudouridine synthase [Planctomycetota bacterium]